MGILDILILLAGILGTWGGAELLVRGSVKVALAVGMRPLVVGLTVVALGTSAPEAVVSILAGAAGSAGIAVGNVVGSNIANIGLVLGLLALLNPIRVHWDDVRDDLAIMVVTTLIACGLAVGGEISRIDGGILFLLLVAYVSFYIRTGHRPQKHDDLRETAKQRPNPWPALGQTLLGLLVLIQGARWFLQGAVQAAAILGVPDEVIGVTMVAVGTSLPELAASVVAVTRGHHEIGVGNILGSNVMNLLFVLPSAAMFAPLEIGPDMTLRMGPAMLAFTLVLLPLMRSGFRLSRPEGAFLLAGYVGFSVWIY